jgi:hypothetical protein
MKTRIEFRPIIGVLALISLTFVCSRPVNATDPVAVDEITALALATKENLAALEAESNQAASDLKIIAARINTRLAEFNLSNSKMLELIKDSREESHAATLSKAQTLATAIQKLKADIEAIDAGMREAGEKAERAMEAAQMQLYIGMVSSLIQISGAASALTQGDTSSFSTLLRNNLPNLNLTVLEMRNDVGITIRVRVGKTISCLSSKQQCSGRAYLISK